MNINSSKSTLLNNIITFQVVWFVSAYWHNNYAALASVGLLAWLFYFENWSKARLKITLQISSIGILTDSLLVYLGFLQFEQSMLLIPFWLVMLWVLFASTFSISLLWMIKKPAIAIIGGTVFGPLSYWAGMQFNALQIVGVNGYIAVSVAWALMMGLFSLLYSKSNKLNFHGSQRI